jgi:hypothetical protein
LVLGGALREAQGDVTRAVQHRNVPPATQSITLDP